MDTLLKFTRVNSGLETPVAVVKSWVAGFEPDAKGTRIHFGFNSSETNVNFIIVKENIEAVTALWEQNTDPIRKN